MANLSYTKFANEMPSKKQIAGFTPKEKVELYEMLIATIPGIERKGATMLYTSLNEICFHFLTNMTPAVYGFLKKKEKIF
jgi:hypothetical protein